MFWSKNKHLKSEEYADLYLKVAGLVSRMDSLEQLVRSVRGLINRKLYPGTESSSIEPQNEHKRIAQEETKDIKGMVYY
jgi:hypothetical protein